MALHWSIRPREKKAGKAGRLAQPLQMVAILPQVALHGNACFFQVYLAKDNRVAFGKHPCSALKHRSLSALNIDLDEVWRTVGRRKVVQRHGVYTDSFSPVALANHVPRIAAREL